MEYPFGQFGSAVLAMSLPNLLSTTSILTVGSGGRDKALMLYKHCSAIAKTFLYYQHCFSHKCKTQHHMLWRKLTPSQPDLVPSQTEAMLGWEWTSVISFSHGDFAFLLHLQDRDSLPWKMRILTSTFLPRFLLNPWQDWCVQSKIPPVHLRIRQTSSPLSLTDGSLLVIKGAGEGGLAQVDLFTLKVVLSSGK